MEFKINEEKKNEIGKFLSQQKKSIKIINFIAKLILVSGISGTVIYAILSIFIETDWIMTFAGGYWHKSYSNLVINSVWTIFEVGALWLMLQALKWNLAGANNQERVDEQLFLEEDELTYLFRVEYQSWGNDRILWRFKLKDMNNVKLDRSTNKLIITGKMDAKYLELTKEEEDVMLDSDKVIEGEAIIHDYFEPSLIETLRNKGVQIEEI